MLQERTARHSPILSPSHYHLLAGTGFFAQRSVLVPCSEQCATQAVDTEKRRRGGGGASQSHLCNCMHNYVARLPDGCHGIDGLGKRRVICNATTQQSVPRLDRAPPPPPPPTLLEQIFGTFLEGSITCMSLVVSRTLHSLRETKQGDHE